MASPFPLRLLIGAALLVSAVLAANATGVPALTAAMLLLGGAAAGLALSRRRARNGSGEVREEAGEPAPVRALMEALAEPALLIDGGRVGTANAAARRILGEWIEGEDVRLVLRHPAAVERLTRNLAATDPAEHAEIVGIGDPDRHWTMSVAALSDGTRFVRLSDRSEAHAAEQMRADFVANASHELRTPLATLVGFSETLLEQGASEDRETRDRFLGIIHDEARRMQRLTDDLLSLSRIEAERFTAPREALALLPLVEEARSNCRYLAEERESVIDVAAPDSLPPVAGDRMQLLQLLDNLIANALRYGRAGAAVSIALQPEGDMLRLTVSDQGEGIAAEHIPRITQRFYRVDPSRSRSLGGTGLGLSIVKHIVERHRGRLSFESELGKGTSVHVLLPVASGPVS